MKAVVDTNVLVSGVLSANGPPGQLLDAVASGLLIPVFSESMLFEYLEVLLRPELGLNRDKVTDLLAALYLSGMLVEEIVFDTGQFTDPDDVPFYAAALAGQCPLITGNRKHFPHHGPVDVLSPREALTRLPVP